MPATPLLSQLPSFEETQQFANRLKDASVSTMLADDAERAADFTLAAAGLQLDYSKQLIDRCALQCLLQLAAETDLSQAISGLLAGEKVNNTEGRPALHTLLRASTGAGLEDKFEEVAAARETMRQWSNRLNAGEHTGFSGAPITDVVNIGIGGSDLGPRLVSEALRPYQGNVACHYVANVDPADLQDTLLELNPDSTLFIVCSKSFRTEETLTNLSLIHISEPTRQVLVSRMPSSA